jgi:hypothetical protein
MNDPKLLLPEVLLGAQPTDQPNLDLASEGVQRYVWHSAYGAMLIEVLDGAAYVNGKRVTSVQELRSGVDEIASSRSRAASANGASALRP